MGAAEHKGIDACLNERVDISSDSTIGQFILQPAFFDHFIFQIAQKKRDDVKANAMLIYSRMTNLSAPMPPPPYPPFTEEQIALFNQWMLDGYAP